MSKFKELFETVIKEWNYPDGFDDSILDGDPLDDGEWLTTAFAVKVFAGQFPDGEDLTDLYALPSYVLYEDKELDLTEELLPYLSVFYKREEAEQVLAEFKTQFLNVDAKIIEVYGLGDGDNNLYYEDEVDAIDAYKDIYRDDQYFAAADDYDDYYD